MNQLIQLWSELLEINSEKLTTGIILILLLYFYNISLDTIQTIFDNTIGTSIYGPVNIPYHILVSLSILGKLYLLFFYKTIWSQCYNFTKINWFYNLSIIAQILFFVMHAIVSLLAVLWIESLAAPINSLFVSIQGVNDKILSVCAIVAFIQFASIPNRLFGMKPFIIGFAVLNSLIFIFNDKVPVFLTTFSTIVTLLYLWCLRRSLPPALPARGPNTVSEQGGGLNG